MFIPLPDTHDDRPLWAATHARCNAALSLAMIEAHVTPLDMGSLDDDEPEPEFCPDCHGSGIQHVPATGAPWRTVEMPCHRCG